MNAATSLPAEVVVPDDASALRIRCVAMITPEVPTDSLLHCDRPATVRIIAVCSDGATGAIPLCNDCWSWDEIDCLHCRKPLTVVAVERL